VLLLLIRSWLIEFDDPLDAPLIDDGALTVQLNVALATLLDSVLINRAPEQIVPLEGLAVMFGIGLTTIV
jgi:hypothetical protein